MNWLYSICGLPFGWLMKLIYILVNNYALAILLFTILTKAILFPISYKQQLSSARMQRLNPKLAKLRKKYKDDPKKLQEEQMKLYQEEHVNPGASCLPMLLQFFLLFGILDVVYRPLNYILGFGSSKINEAALAIDAKAEDLRRELEVLSAHHMGDTRLEGIFVGNQPSQMTEFYDNFTLFGIPLGEVPSWKPEVWNYTAIGLFLIPILSGVIQLILTIYMQIMQRRRNPDMPSMGCMNVMMYIMPVFSVVFAFNVPAGVGFYWVCSSFFSLIQSMFLYRYFTPQRVDQIVEKQNAKLERKYASGRTTFTQRMMGQIQGQTEAEKARAEKIEASKHMSRNELSKFQNEQIKEARRRMAEKYGDSYGEEE